MKGRYRKGYRKEKRSRALLERDGFFVVESRGSHGAWDLVALDLNELRCDPNRPRARVVQVKSNRGGSLKARLIVPGMPSWIQRETHVWKDRASEPIITVW